MDVSEFPKEMQKLLLKKEKEYGQLKFISSRATEETSHFIDELLEVVMNIAKEFSIYDVKMFYEGGNFKLCEISVINYYNHFVLNTNFSSQCLLAEDMMVGHLVDFWPTLSPYLFIQMIWHIKCEDLLIESLMHLPLDICVEILEITIRCINDLEILRYKRFVFLLLPKLYYRCMRLNLGILSKRSASKLAHELVGHFQALLLNLASSKFITPKIKENQENYVQHGIFLKDIFRCIKICMYNKTKNYQNNELLQSFEITYGNPNGCTDYFCKLPIDEVQSIITTLNQELVTLLQDQIKQVDCFEFMEWAEVDDEENVIISLQRAIIIECHCFIEFMKHDEFLLTNEHLLHCLQQLVGSNNSGETILTLQELCDSITNGKLDEEIGMKELVKHYKKWDLSVLNFISRETKLLNVMDLGILLEYLHYMFAHTHINEEKHQAYILVLKVLIQQQLSTMYHLILQYTLRHFHDNHLTCLFNSEHFKKFIESNINMHDQEKLRVILIFVMLNPKEVLTTLVRVAIGSTETKYRNVMFKRPQLAYLHTFLTSKLDDQNNLLTYLLNQAWLEDHSAWCYKQFEAFMNDMLENETITPDNLLNNIYIPCLTSNVSNYSNLLSVLIHMYSVLKREICTQKTNYVILIMQLTKKMSMIRKCSSRYLRNAVNSLLYRGTMILNLLFTTSGLTLNSQNEIIKINNFVEPIDQILLVLPLQTIRHGTVQDVIQNYERRCMTYQLLHANPQLDPELSDVYSFQLDRKALLRHMILHATEEEYKNFAIEMTMVSWAYFGWANELVAYENVLHITTEAMQLALVFTDTFPKDTFVSLLRALVQYCNTLSYLKHRRKDREEICNILSKTLLSLKSIVKETQHGKIYDNLLECINSMDDESYFEVADYFHNINKSIEEYFVQSEEIECGTLSDNLENENSSHSASTTSETVDMFKAYQFVCKFI